MNMRVLINAAPLLIRSAGVKNYLYHWIAGPPPESVRPVPSNPATFDKDAPLNREGSVLGFSPISPGLAALALSNHSAPARNGHACRARRYFPRQQPAPPCPSTPSARRHLARSTHLMDDAPRLHPAANRLADQHLAGRLRRADGIIAVSECTRRDAIRVLDVGPEKIVVVSPAWPMRSFTSGADAIAAVQSADAGLTSGHSFSPWALWNHARISAL